MAQVGRPLKFKSVEELEKKIDEYFQNETGWIKREVYDKKKQEVVEIEFFEPATITGLAVYLDTSRETLREYSERPEYVDAIKKAKDKCQHALEYGALTNKLNPTMAIFSAKNNYGWKDRQNIGLDGGEEGEPIKSTITVEFRDFSDKKN